MNSGITRESFRRNFYTGRIVRYRGERKVVKTALMSCYFDVVITFVDNTKCTNLKDIELDGRR